MSGPLDLSPPTPAPPGEQAAPAQLDEQLLRRVRRWSRREVDEETSVEVGAAVIAPPRRRPWWPLLVLALIIVSAALLAAALASALGGTPAAEPARALAAPAATTTRCPIPAAFRPAFARAARAADLPLALLVAVAEHESGFRPSVTSEAGAYGLLQVMPDAAEALRLDAYEPRDNVLAGARILRGHLDRFRSTDVALAAYNAGPAAVVRAGGAPSGEVVRYVANVTERWRELRGCR